ncbi:C GCAxxG C C family protein [Gottschalkia purinilytica]|uniref:C GCAxxG C C family protein n=1 Tax=Gottschalkia purinilytica TaxID=1503 RepID=A0A0L0W8F3_GOTPU|nr:C-GCAxxG-C-C family protein [Gottschalkia purinilytica]KNF07550.1 C GCAxxG C C family protein [Gottschalkia purinilytica]
MDKKQIISDVRSKAEGYYDRGEFFCSEAVVHAINELLGWPFPENITKLASAFPVGLGKSGCLCGAVSGGAMALGMAYGRKYGDPMKDEMFPISAQLHDHIRSIYKSTCCRVLVKGHGEFGSPERKKHCVEITGEVAAWIAEKLLEDEQISSKIQEALAECACSSSDCGGSEG